QLGDGTTSNRSIPARVSTLSGVIAIAAGWDVSAAARNDGTLWVWGSTYGPVPRLLPGLDQVIAVTINGPRLVLKRDGTVWNWDQSPPVQVPGLSNIVEISSDYDHGVAR